MDFRLKAEENKQKYLDMLTTKIFSNEEEIVGLSVQSHKIVSVVCPKCSKVRQALFRDTTRSGHTLCIACSKTLGAYSHMIGEKYHYLTVLSFADDIFLKNGQRKSAVKAVCDCGKEVIVSAQAIKSGNTNSCGCWNKEVMSLRRGELSAQWNPDLPLEERKGKRGYAVTRWSLAVKRRDNFTCQVCGSTEKPVAHHLNSYKNDKDARYDIENGITLCRDCHTDFHVNFMDNYRVPCTSEDFEEYLMQV